MFFKAIAQYQPDLVIFSGVHMLESQVRADCERQALGHTSLHGFSRAKFDLRNFE